MFHAAEMRLDRQPERMRTRRCTVEHPFGTLKSRMGHTHFQMRTLHNVGTEMSLHVLAYNLKRVMAILGPKPLMAAMRAYSQFRARDGGPCKRFLRLWAAQEFAQQKSIVPIDY